MSNKPTSDKLMKAAEEYYGRPITSEMLAKHEKLICMELEVDRFEQKRGIRYGRRVWVKLDRASYLREQAIRAAELADQIRKRLLMGVGPGYSSYFLTNPHGSRFSTLGDIHFRFPSVDPEFLNLSSCYERYDKVVEIERVNLHPSLRKQGFMRLLGGTLHKIGFRGMVCSHVYNSILAYHWMRQSLDRNSGVYSASKHTIDDFIHNFNPGPSFAMDLDRWTPCGRG